MKKVITYGTFDLFHQGHYNILKRAKELGDYLIVGVTGETYDIERGKLSVRDSLVERIENVKKTGFADLIIVEEYLGQKIQDIIKYDVDVLVVGSDWIGQFDHMRKYCEVVYLERTKNISSTQLRESSKIMKIGIATDNLNDDDVVMESKYVSGVHPEAVYSDDKSVSDAFVEQYELDAGFTDYDEFLEAVDFVYVKTHRDKKYKLIRKALEQDKVVLSTPIIGNDADEVRELYEYASENNKILVECLPTFYLQAFVQLLWNARGNLIGDLLYVKNGFWLGNLAGIEESDLLANVYFSVLTAEELLGRNMDFSFNTVSSGDDAQFGVLVGKSAGGIYLSEIGKHGSVSSRMEIIGTDGEIIIPDEWWYTGYFELHRKGESQVKRYSWNFEGNGLRYVIMSALPKAGATPSSSDIRIPSNEIINAFIKTEELIKTGR
ncbi:MAG: adenylyltransferase/cytidyltransferase family protein [Bacillota bacterium]